MESRCPVCGTPLQAEGLFCVKCQKPANRNLDPNNIDKMSIGQLVALLFVLLIVYGWLKPAFDRWRRGEDQPDTPRATSRQDGSNMNSGATGPDPRYRRSPAVGPRTGDAHVIPDNDPLHGERELREP